MMAHEPSAGKAISLDDLVALNDEIAALTRAGVPLEHGLAAIGSDMPGRLGRIAKMLAERTRRGESLASVLADPSCGLPPLYRAVVEAGLRAGRLPCALESLASAMRNLAQTRRSILAASLYPFMVLIVACGMLVVSCTIIAPPLVSSLKALNLPGQELFGVLAAMGHWAAYWGLGLPLLIFLLLLAWWRRTCRAEGTGPRWTDVVMQGLPWVGRAVRFSRMSTFTEILGLLIENHVPLGEAFLLAARASGDRRLKASAARIAAALAQGQPIVTAVAGEAAMPPRVRWLFATAARQGDLARPLVEIAQNYRRQALYDGEIVRILAPVLMTAVVGGGVTLGYALMLFIPYTNMLRALI